MRYTICASCCWSALGSAVTAWLVSLFVTSAQSAPVDLRVPASAIGHASVEGKPYLIHPIGSVDFGTRSPDQFLVFIEFSLGVESKEELFGIGGFSIPFFDSRVVEIDEETLIVFLPCGKKIGLEKGSNGLFLSADRQWEYSRVGRGMRLERDDGWRLDFTDGRLSVLCSDLGDTLRWIRNKNGDMRVVLEGEGPVAVLGRIEPGEFELEVNGELTKIRQGAGGEFDTELPSGEKFYFRMGDSMLKVENDSTILSTLTWDPSTNYILSDGVNRYQVERRLGNGIAISIKDSLRKIKRVNIENGRVQSLEFLSTGKRLQYLYGSKGADMGRLQSVSLLEPKLEAEMDIFVAGYSGQGVLEHVETMVPVVVDSRPVMPDYYFPEKALSLVDYLGMDTGEREVVSIRYLYRKNGDHYATMVNGKLVLGILAMNQKGPDLERADFCWEIRESDEDGTKVTVRSCFASKLVDGLRVQMDVPVYEAKSIDGELIEVKVRGEEVEINSGG